MHTEHCTADTIPDGMLSEYQVYRPRRRRPGGRNWPPDPPRRVVVRSGGGPGGGSPGPLPRAPRAAARSSCSSPPLLWRGLGAALIESPGRGGRWSRGGPRAGAFAPPPVALLPGVARPPPRSARWPWGPPGGVGSSPGALGGAGGARSWRSRVGSFLPARVSSRPPAARPRSSRCRARRGFSPAAPPPRPPPLGAPGGRRLLERGPLFAALSLWGPCGAALRA